MQEQDQDRGPGRDIRKLQQARIEANLDYLRSRGALHGIEMIVAERRRQIEVCGYDAQHDAEHPWAELPRIALMRLAGSLSRHTTMDQSDAELAEAGALAAAGLDRTVGVLGRVMPS
jgi:hypothetical protein